MFLKMPILNKIQNVYRASRKLRPAMRIFERCKSSRFPPRFVNSRRSVTGGDILKDVKIKDLASNAKIHSKLRIEEPDTGLVLDVNLKYSFRKIPGHLPPFEGELEGDSVNKNFQNGSENVWYDFIHDADPDMLDISRQYILADKFNSPSKGGKFDMISKKRSGSSLSSSKSYQLRKKSVRKSAPDKYNTKVCGRIDITSPQFNPQQFGEALHGVVQNVMANSFHTLLQKVSEDQLKERARHPVSRPLNPSRRRLNLKSSRSTSSHGSGYRREKYGSSSVGSVESSKTAAQASVNVPKKHKKDVLDPVIETPKSTTRSRIDSLSKSSVLKSEECSIVLSSNNPSKKAQDSTKTLMSDSKVEDFQFLKKFANESFALASMHINPSTASSQSRKDKIPADEIPPFYHIVPKLKEHEESKGKTEVEKSKPKVGISETSKNVSTRDTAIRHSNNVKPVTGVRSHAPFLAGCTPGEQPPVIPETGSIKPSSSQNTLTTHKKQTIEGINRQHQQSRVTKSEDLSKAVQEFRVLYSNFINSVKTGGDKVDCSEGQCVRNSSKINPGAKFASNMDKPSCGKIDAKTAKEITSSIIKNLRESMTEDVKQQKSLEFGQQKTQKLQEDATILKATEEELKKAIRSDCSKPNEKAQSSKESPNNDLSGKETTVKHSKKSNSNQQICESTKLGKQSGKDSRDKPSGTVTNKRDTNQTDSKTPIDCSKFKVVSEVSVKVYPTMPNCPNRNTNSESQSKESSSSKAAPKRSQFDPKNVPTSATKDCTEPNEKPAPFSTCTKQIPDAKSGSVKIEVQPVSNTFRKFEKASSLPVDCGKFKISNVQSESDLTRKSTGKVDFVDYTKYKTSNASKEVNSKSAIKQEKSTSLDKPFDCSKFKVSNVLDGSPKYEKDQKIATSKGNINQECASGTLPSKSAKPDVSARSQKQLLEDKEKTTAPIDCSKFHTKQVLSKNESRQAAGMDGTQQGVKVHVPVGEHDPRTKKPVDRIERGTTEVLSKNESQAAENARLQEGSPTAFKPRSQPTGKATGKKPSSHECRQNEKAASPSSKSTPALSATKNSDFSVIDCSRFKASDSFISKSVSNSIKKDKTGFKPSDCNNNTKSSKPIEKMGHQSNTGITIDCSKYKSTNKNGKPKQSDGNGRTKIDCSKYETTEDHTKKQNPITRTSSKSPDNIQTNSNGNIDCSKYSTSDASTKKSSPTSTTLTGSKPLGQIDCSKYKSTTEPTKRDASASTSSRTTPPGQIDCSKYKTANEPKIEEPLARSSSVSSKQPGQIDCSKYKPTDDLNKTKSATATTSMCSKATENKPSKSNDNFRSNPDSKTEPKQFSEPMKSDQKDPPAIDCSKYEAKVSNGHSKTTSDCSKSLVTNIDSRSVALPDKPKEIDCSKYKKTSTAKDSNKLESSLCKGSNGCCNNGSGDGCCAKADCCKGSKETDCSTLKCPDNLTPPEGPLKSVMIDSNKQTLCSTTTEPTVKHAAKPRDGFNKQPPCEPMKSDTPFYRTQETPKTIDCSKYRTNTKDSYKTDSIVSCKYEITPTSAKFPVQTASHIPTSESVQTSQHKNIECPKSSDTGEPVETKKSVSETPVKTCSNTLNELTNMRKTSTNYEPKSVEIKLKDNKITQPIESKRSSSEVRTKPCSNISNQTSAPSSLQSSIETKPKETKLTKPVEAKRASNQIQTKPCSNTLDTSPLTLKKTSGECPQNSIQVKSKEPVKSQTIETKESLSEIKVKPCSNILKQTPKDMNFPSPQLNKKSLEDVCSPKQSKVEIKPHASAVKVDPNQRSVTQKPNNSKTSKISSFLRKTLKGTDKAKGSQSVSHKYASLTAKTNELKVISSKPDTCRPVMCTKQKKEVTIKSSPVLKADVAKRIQVKSTAPVFNCCLKITGPKKVEVNNCPMPIMCDDCKYIL